MRHTNEWRIRCVVCMQVIRDMVVFGQPNTQNNNNDQPSDEVRRNAHRQCDELANTPRNETRNQLIMIIFIRCALCCSSLSSFFEIFISHFLHSFAVFFVYLVNMNRSNVRVFLLDGEPGRFVRQCCIDQFDLALFVCEWIIIIVHLKHTASISTRQKICLCHRIGEIENALVVKIVNIFLLSFQLHFA